MSGTNYEPKPIETSGVKLSPAENELIEELARNTHEVWSRKRMRDGWTWGPERNDREKKHPDLVRYEELSEEERSYDKEVVSEVVKAMLALGYRIEKRNG